MKNRQPLKAQPGNGAPPKEMIQLVNRERLAAFTTHNAEVLSSALTVANDPTARAWTIYRVNGLKALGCWRFLPWDSQMLDCPSGSVGGLWSKESYAEQRHRLETAIKASIADAEAHGVRFLSTRLPEDGLAALHTVEAAGFRIIESFLTFSRKTTGEIPFDRGSDFHIRLAQPDEMETVGINCLPCLSIVSACVLIHRFLNPRARHSRREWVRNGFKGRAEAIYVAESENRLVGFVLLRSKTEKMGKI